MSRHIQGQRRPGAAPARHPGLPPLKRPEDMERRGTVKFFDARRGFGFITSEGHPDVFLHVSVASKYGLTDLQLEAGIPVRFSATPRGGRRNEEVDAIAVAS